MIDVNSTFTTWSKYTCLTINAGQTESICSAIVLNVQRGVSRNEVVDAIFQVNHLWGFWKKHIGNGANSECWYDSIEIQPRQSRVSSVVVEKPLRNSFIRLLPVRCCSVHAVNSAKLVLSVATAT